MKTLSKTVLVPLAAVVVLASIWMFHGRRRAYAQEPTTLTFTLPTFDSATTQRFIFNVLNDTEFTLPATLNIANEDGTQQSPPETITAAPHQNIQFDYTPPLVTTPGSSLPVAAPFVPQITILMDELQIISTNNNYPRLVCADAEALDKATKAVAFHQWFVYTLFEEGEAEYQKSIKQYGIACWHPGEPKPPHPFD